MKAIIFAIMATLTMLFSTSTAMAGGMYEVSRTSTLESGIFVPALAVLVAGERHILKLGENGLTRSIVFDADKARAFAVANVTLPAGVVLQVALRGGGAVDAFGNEISSAGPSW
jgi:hypothetical protein